ncbi:hypothetical protein [Paenibacillus arenosi]|uniref:Peptidase S1 domain-containing protein n=1 Tax=Paenibacillus arenosi TaxID=2774142 RepID=A0ABR9AXV0_9BACL|nr:hypothetical protein [Paenibacillus arenosi]MBD8498022.1 hypothetical protein [Paenibacillus arenosi]
MANFYAAYKAKIKHAAQLLQKKGIVGVGVGYKNPKQPKQGACVIIYTETASAVSTSSVPKSVSTTVQGKVVQVPIRTIVSGKVKVFHDAKAKVAPYTDRIRPVPGGYSVGYPSLPGSPGVSGTGGLIAINYPARTQYYVCSNNHVLNRNNSADYTETIQPGAADSGQATTDEIGRLDRFIPLQKTGDNYLDAATCIPLDNSLLSPTYATVGVVPGHLLTYRVGEVFKKVGRTTGAVTGTVESVHTDFTVNYGDYGGLGVIQFRDQSVILGATPTSLPGDSGSIWLRSSDNYAAAVNYAGFEDGLRSISYPFNWFSQLFNVRVAQPNIGAGDIKGVRMKSYSYTRPLTKKQISTLKSVLARKATEITSHPF